MYREANGRFGGPGIPIEDGWSSVDNWLSRLSPSSFKVQKYIIGRFMRWLGESSSKFREYTPDQLIEYQKAAGNGEHYEILDVVQKYVNEMEGRPGYKRKTYSSLRSFFAHNRIELPRDRTYSVRSEKVAVVGKLTIEEAKQMFDGANPTYRAITLSMFQAGMGLGEYDYWNKNGYDDLLSQLAEIKTVPKEKRLVKIQLPGRKRSRNVRPYYTFIGSDAIEAIEAYLVKRALQEKRIAKEGLKLEPEGCIFYNKDRNPVSRNAVKLYWLRHLEKNGFIERKRNKDKSNRYGKNVHELRTLFRTQWDIAPGAKGNVAEYLMGHDIDPNDYNQFFRREDYVRDQYFMALPYLQLMTHGEAFNPIPKDELKTQSARIRELELQLINERQRFIDMEEEIRMASDFVKLSTKLREADERFIENTKKITSELINRVAVLEEENKQLKEKIPE